MSAKSREAALAQIESDLEAARKAYSDADDEIAAVEAERARISGNGVSKKKLDDLRQRLKDARRARADAEETINDLLPDAQQLRQAVEQRKNREIEIERMERQVGCYEAQAKACELLAQVHEVLAPFRQSVGSDHLLPTIAEIARKIDPNGRMDPDSRFGVPQQVQVTLEESRRRLAELKGEQ